MKLLPFYLKNREVVFRQFWRSEEGKVVISLESIDDSADYGASLRTKRVKVRTLMISESLPAKSGGERQRE